MVAIVNGNDVGLFNSSLNLLRNFGPQGNATLGRSGEQVLVNATTGNLVIRNQDEYLASAGLDAAVVRTYNSQGQFDGDNNDQWRLNVASLKGLPTAGAINARGSTVTKVFGDGAEVTYNFDTAAGLYLSTDGDGAHDTLRYNSANAGTQWAFTDGSTQTTEYYSSTGKLFRVTDTDGNVTSYGYNAIPGSPVTSITTASGEIFSFAYAGRNISEIGYQQTAGGVLSSRVRYFYDARNRLNQVVADLNPNDGFNLVDKDGDGAFDTANAQTYVTRYTYDGSSKRIASIITGAGEALSFTYIQDPVSSAWKLKAYINGEGNLTTFDYGNATTPPQSLIYNKTDVIGPLGTTTYVYDPQGRLVQIQAPTVNGQRNSTTYGYDVQDNVTSVTDANGATLTMTYDAQGNRTLQRDSAGNTLAYTYSARNQVLTETRYKTPDPDGTGPQNAADPLTTRYLYDSEDHLRFIVSAAGRVTEHRYTTVGQRETTLAYTVATYDDPTVPNTLAEMEYWAQVTDKSKAQRVDYRYDFRGQLQTKTTFAALNADGSGQDASKSVTNYIYDARGLLLETIDARGTASTALSNDYLTAYTYDGLGRVWTTSTRNEIGSVISTSTMSYDDVGNRVLTTAANGLITASSYDKRGLLIAMTQMDGATPLGTTRYFYDAAGRLRVSEDPTQVQTARIYDAANRLVGTIDGTGALVEYRYDPAGNNIRTVGYARQLSPAQLALAQNPALNVSLADLLTIADPSPLADDTSDRVSHAIYDNANRLVYRVDAEDAVTRNNYDGTGNITDVIQYATLLTPDQRQALNAQPSPTVGDIAVAIDPAQDRRTRNFYDNDSKLIGTLDAQGYFTEHTYDASGQLVKTQRYATPATVIDGTFAQITAALAAANSGVGDQITHAFYNAQGQQIAMLETETAAVGTPVSDIAYVLTEYEYDLAGNRTAVKRYANTANAYTGTQTLAQLRPNASLNDQVTTTAYTALNQTSTVTSTDGTITKYSYDTMGNLIRTDRALGTSDIRTTHARYDLRNRLIQELTGEGSVALDALLASNPSATQLQRDAVWALYGLTHTYDAAGRRISTRSGGLAAMGSGQPTPREVQVSATYVTPDWGFETQPRIELDNAGNAVLIWQEPGTDTAGNAQVNLFTRRYQSDGTWGDKVQLNDATATGYVVASGVQVAKDGAGNFAVTWLQTDGQGPDRLYLKYTSGTSWSAAILVDEGARLPAMSMDSTGQVTLLWVKASYNADFTQSGPGVYARTYSTKQGLSTVTPIVTALPLAPSGISAASVAFDASGNAIATWAQETYNAAVPSYTSQIHLSRYSAVSGLWSAPELVEERPNVRIASIYEAGRPNPEIAVDAAGNAIIVWEEQILFGSWEPRGGVYAKRYDATLNQWQTTRTLVQNGNPFIRPHIAMDAQGNATLVWTQNNAAGTQQELHTERYDATQGWTGDKILSTGVILNNAQVRIDANGTTTVVWTQAGAQEGVFTAHHVRNQGWTGIELVEGVSGSSFVRAPAITVNNQGKAFATWLRQDSSGIGAPVYVVASRVELAPANQTSSTTRFYYDNANRLVATLQDADNGSDIVNKAEIKQTTYNAFGQADNERRYSNRIDTQNLTGGLIDQPTTQGSIRNQLAALRNDSTDNQVSTMYNRRGLFSGSVDGENYLMQNRYNAFGDLTQKLQQIAQPGNTFRLVAEAQGAATVVQHQYQYDKRGIQTKIIWDVNGLNTQESHRVDAFGRRSEHTDANGNTTRYQYDKLGRIVTVTDPANAKRVTTYDAFNRVLTQTDAMGNSTTTSYDEQARQVTVSTAEGVQTKTTSNRHGQTVQVTDGNTNSTTYNYDVNGNLTQITDANNKVIERNSYDTAGRKLTVTDGNGNVTRFNYDAASRVLRKVVDAQAGGLNLTTEYQYDGQGRATTITIGKGRADESITQTIYDRNGRATSVIVDPKSINPAGLNLTTTYVYDGRGNTVLVTEGAGTQDAKVTQYFFDSVGRRTREIVDPNGLKIATKYKYDQHGNVVTKIDAEKHVTRYVYDADNRLVYTIDGTGAVSKSVYDSNGRVIRTTQYEQRIALVGLGLQVTERELSTLTTSLSAVHTHSLFDRDGRLRYVVDALGAISEKRYDGAGNVVQTVRYAQPLTADLAVLNGATTSDHIDVMPTLQQATQMGSPDDHKAVTVFDRANRAVFKIDAYGDVVEMVYDAAGNMTKTIAYATRLGSTYVNDVMQATLANVRAALDLVAKPALDHISYYVYDPAGRMKYAVDALGYVTETVYTAARLTSRTIEYYDAIATTTLGPTLTAQDVSNGLAARTAPQAAKDQITAYVYDDAGRLLTKTRAWGSADATTDTYHYDAMGRVIAHTNGNGHTNYSAYDAAGRLIRTIDAMGYVVEMNYDGLGNKTLQSTYLKPTSLPLATNYRWAYKAPPALKRSYTERITQYVYDAVGRLVSSGQVLTDIARPRGQFSSINGYSLGNADQQVMVDPDGNIFVLWQRPISGGTSQLQSYSYDASTGITQPSGFGGFGDDMARPRIANNKKGDAFAIFLTNEKSGTRVRASKYLGYLEWDGPTSIDGRSPGIVFGGDPQIAMDEQGNTVVTWVQQDGTGPNDHALYANVYNSSTGTWQGAQLIQAGVTVDVTARVTYSNKGPLVVWSTPNNGIASALFWAAAGVPSWVPMGNVVVGNGGVSKTPHLAADSQGNVLVAWTQDDAGTTNLYVCRFTAGWGAAELLQSNIGAVVGNPRIGFDSAGQAFVAWNQADGVYVNRLQPGSEWSGAVRISGNTSPGANTQPRIAFDAQNNAYVTWQGTHLEYVSARSGPPTTVTVSRVFVARYMTGIGWRSPALFSNPGAQPGEPAEIAANVRGDIAGARVGTPNLPYMTWSVVPNAGPTTRYAYDALGRLVETTQAVGTSDERIIRRGYDQLGRVTEEVFGYGTAKAATSRFKYDFFGNQIEVFDPRAHELTETNSAWALAERERLGLIKIVAVPGGSQIVPLTASELTPNQTDQLRAPYRTTQTFDRLNRKTSASILGEAGTLQRTESVYDAFGNIVKIIDPRGNAGYNYFDTLNRVNFQISPGGYATAVQYDRYGSETKTIRYAQKVGGTYDEKLKPILISSSVDPRALGLITWVVESPSLDQLNGYYYDNLNRHVKSLDSAGRGDTYTYDAVGNAVIHTDSNFNQTTYKYDANNRKVLEQLPVTAYDAATKTDHGVENAFVYDALGNLVKKTKAVNFSLDASSITYVYDRFGNVVTEFTSGQTATKYWTYDKRGNLLTSRETYSGARYYYDANNRRIAMVDAERYLHTYEYDSAGNVVLTRTYGGRIPAIVDLTIQPLPELTVDITKYRETLNRYDNRNHLIESSTRAVLVYSTTYSDTTKLASTSSDIRLTTKFSYDANSKLIGMTDPSGGKTFYFYDKDGNRTAQIDPRLFVIIWDYDAFGNVVLETRFASSISAAVLATALATGIRPTPTRSPDDRVVSLTYDLANRKASEAIQQERYYLDGRDFSDPVGPGGFNFPRDRIITYYTYDGEDNLTLVWRGTNDAIAYAYDGINRKTEEQGRQISDYRGATVRRHTQLSYDARGNLIAKSISSEKQGSAEDLVGTIDGTTPVATKRFTYNKEDRLTHEYDELNNVIEYTYDPISGDLRTKVEWRTDPGLAGAYGSKRKITTTYEYDNFHRLKAITDAEGVTKKSFYNAYGELDRRGISSGLGYRPAQENFQYDDAGRLVKSNAGTGVDTIYLYDANGNNTAKIQSPTQNIRNSNWRDFAYAANSDTSFWRYVYNASNLRTHEIQPGTSLDDSPLVTTSSYNAFGELESTRNTSFRQEYNQTRYFYNKRGQVVKKVSPYTQFYKQDPTDSGRYNYLAWGAPTEEYYYDVDGNRIGTRDANGTLSVRFYNAEGVLVKEETNPESIENNVVTTYGVDGLGRTRTKNSGVFGITKYDYNAKGEVVKVHTPVDNSMKVWKTYSSNLVSYDVLKTLSSQGMLQRTDEYRYNEIGQQIAHKNALGNWEYTYYDNGGETRRTVSYGGIAVEYANDYVADLDRFVSTIAYADGTRNSVSKDYFGQTQYVTDRGNRTYRNFYDRMGQLRYEVANTQGTLAIDISTDYYDVTKYASPDAYWSQQGSFGMDKFVEYTYFESGRLSSVKDYATSIKQTFAYKRGLLSSTEMNSANGMMRKTDIIYDTLGRVRDVYEAGHNSGVRHDTQTEYLYDANGNRIRIRTQASDARYFDTAQLGNNFVDDVWYTYDKQNRVLISRGQGDAVYPFLNQNPSRVHITRGNGTENFYNSSGQRSRTLTSFLSGDNVTIRTSDITYVYNRQGLLWAAYVTGTEQNKVYLAAQSYDAVGNLLAQTKFSEITPGAVRAQTETHYAADNKASREKYWEDGTYKHQIFYGYGADGSLIRTYETPNEGPSVTTDYHNEYWTDVKQSSAVANGRRLRPGYSKFTYDASGRMINASADSLNNTMDHTMSISYDALGNAIHRSEFLGADQQTRQHAFYYYGRTGFADFGDTGFLAHDYGGGTTVKRGVAVPGNIPVEQSYYPTLPVPLVFNEVTGQYEPGAPNERVYTNLPSANVGAISVYVATFDDALGTSVDLFMRLALQTWGDSSLWHVLADANHMLPGQTISEGKTIVIPSVQRDFHNNTSTFRPFDPTRSVTGYIAAPEPKEASCGQEFVLTIIPPMLAVVGFLLGNYEGAAAGAAIGDYINQWLMKKWGLIENIDEAQIGRTALFTYLTYGNPIHAALLSESYEVVIGNKELSEFDWKRVAIAAVMQKVTQGINNDFAGVPTNLGQSNSLSGLFGDLARGAASGFVAEGLRTLAYEDHEFSWAAVGADSFTTAFSAATPKPQSSSKGTIFDQVGRKLAATYRDLGLPFVEDKNHTAQLILSGQNSGGFYNPSALRGDPFAAFGSQFDPNRFDGAASDDMHQWQMERQQSLRFDTAQIGLMNFAAVATQSQKEQAAQQATAANDQSGGMTYPEDGGQWLSKPFAQRIADVAAYEKAQALQKSLTSADIAQIQRQLRMETLSGRGLMSGSPRAELLNAERSFQQSIGDSSGSFWGDIAASLGWSKDGLAFNPMMNTFPTEQELFEGRFNFATLAMMPVTRPVGLGVKLVGGGLKNVANTAAAESRLLKIPGQIETPWGPALQSSSPAAFAARSTVEEGATLYRLGTIGKSEAAEAQFWALEHPLSPGYASRYGIPPENVAKFNFIESATLKPGTPFVTRPAPGIGTNPGGGIEAVVPKNGVTLKYFSGQ